MGRIHRIVWAALFVVGALALGCNDEKKPPLTPDGPDMTAPVGGDAGDVPAAPTAAPAK